MIALKQKQISSVVHNCKQCSYRTTSIPSIEDHVKRHKRECSQKQFSCTISVLEAFSCDRCTYKTMFFVNLKKHVKTHIKTRGSFKEEWPEKLWRCKDKSCNFITYSRLIFLKHARNKCAGRLKELEKFAVPITPESALTEDSNWFKCDQCPYTTESNVFMNMHKSAEHSDTTVETKDHINVAKIQKEDNVQLADYTAEEVKIPILPHIENLNCIEDENAKLRCRFCFCEVANTDALRTHFMRVHTETNIYPCKKCHYVAKSKKGLQIHMKMKHKEAKGYPCPYCSFEAQKPRNLEQHMWNNYSEHIKWFSCKKCAYKTIFEDAWKAHKDGHDEISENCCETEGGSSF